MEPRIDIVTLGVRDLERATAFYRYGLGWPVSGASSGGISFFETGGTVLALYPLQDLAADASSEPHNPHYRVGGFPGFTLARNVADRDEVSRVLGEAAAAGATIVKEAQDVFWGGHSGYFADPERYLWEVAWNPYVTFAGDRSIEMPG